MLFSCVGCSKRSPRSTWSLNIYATVTQDITLQNQPYTLSHCSYVTFAEGISSQVASPSMFIREHRRNLKLTIAKVKLNFSGRFEITANFSKNKKCVRIQSTKFRKSFFDEAAVNVILLFMHTPNCAYINPWCSTPSLTTNLTSRHARCKDVFHMFLKKHQ